MNLKKLKSMSLHEVGHRVKLAGTKRLLRFTHNHHREELAAGRFLREFALPSDYDGPFADAIANNRWWAAEEFLLDHMRARTNGYGYHSGRPRFFFSPSQRSEMLQLIGQHLPDIVPEVLAHAEKLLDHQFSFLGVEVRYEDEIDWCADPVSRQRWPMKFYADLRFYGRQHGNRQLPGDVKYVWELNRHQHFVVLGKAHWMTRDERYAVEVFAQINNWIDQNPYLRGINWTSALEVALRSLSWTWAYFYCLEAKSFDARTHAALLRMLQLHGRYINHHLSFYTSPYNHLIGEAAALFTLGTLFQEFKEARAWRQRGWSILQAEISKQFHSDGISKEQAISYHHFTLGFYLLASILAQRNNVPIPAPMRQQLERALEFSMFSIQPDGRHPMIGDNDDARSISFGARPAWDFRDLLAVGAVLFGRGDLRQLAAQYDEACLWLLGPSSCRQFHALDSHAPEARTKLFPESGYTVFRNGWGAGDQYLIFDAGHHSEGLHPDDTVSTAHGHADYLAFSLCAHGVPLLIDAGMLTYNGDRKWQNYFRSGMAHNTITVDGRSACELAGRLAYFNVPNVLQSFYCRQDDFVFAEATYTGFAGEVQHHRGIFYRPGEYWLILDALYGEGEHVIDLWLHFPNDTPVVHQNGMIRTDRPDRKNLALFEIGPWTSAVEIFQGGREPHQGWIAPEYGRKVPAPVARLRRQERLPVQYTTLILPFGENVPELSHEVSGEHSTRSATPFGLRLKTATWQDHLVFNFTGTRRQVGTLRTDAKIVFIRRNARSEMESATLVKGSELVVDGKQIVNSEKVIDVKVSALK